MKIGPRCAEKSTETSPRSARVDIVMADVVDNVPLSDGGVARHSLQEETARARLSLDRTNARVTLLVHDTPLHGGRRFTRDGGPSELCFERGFFFLIFFTPVDRVTRSPDERARASVDGSWVKRDAMITSEKKKSGSAERS